MADVDEGIARASTPVWMTSDRESIVVFVARPQRGGHLPRFISRGELCAVNVNGDITRACAVYTPVVPLLPVSFETDDGQSTVIINQLAARLI